MRCLAEAIYFESRGEPEQGQAAVAQVVLNRVRSGIYSTNVCAVVYQDRNRPFACQFSFACEGKSLRIEEPGAWTTATRIAQEVVSGDSYDPEVAEAVNYHASYVSPFWARLSQPRRPHRHSRFLCNARRPQLGSRRPQRPRRPAARRRRRRRRRTRPSPPRDRRPELVYNSSPRQATRPSHCPRRLAALDRRGEMFACAARGERP